MYWLWKPGQAQIYSSTQRTASFTLHYEQPQQNQPSTKLPGLSYTRLKYLYSNVPFPTPQYSKLSQVIPSATNHFFVVFNFNIFFYYITVY